MKELTKEQKKIIYIALIIAGFILAFVVFVYAPQSKRLAAIRMQLNAAEAQIAEISRITEGKDLNQAVKDLSSKLTAASKTLPPDEESIIASLTEAAKKSKVQINTLDPDDKIKLAQGVAGYDLSELPIKLSLSGEYRAIGEYIDGLLNDFPNLVRVKQLSIQGKGEGRPILDANLQISVYLAHGK
ncbi:MAG: type 4a pilus biogenesis protein PilO [Candidatus Omnitrophica bacterium]|nr:type 4a pilus biogenesis protein PilO [Candidatus Omnitrophota bacterium]